MSVNKAIIFCLVFLLSGCIPQLQTNENAVTIAPPTNESAATIASPTQPSQIVTITGWFTTIWNTEPHYSITDDQGQTTRLLLDEELAKPLGVPLELDRKRVTVMGEIVNEPQGALRVLSISFEK